MRLQIHFFALFFFIFFLAMALFLGVGVNFGRVGSSRGLIALDLSLGLRPLTERKNDTEPVPTAIKKRKKLLFFCSLTDVQLAINPHSAR
jgi:hypothetical protein